VSSCRVIGLHIITHGVLFNVLQNSKQFWEERQRCWQRLWGHIQRCQLRARSKMWVHVFCSSTNICCPISFLVICWLWAMGSGSYVRERCNRFVILHSLHFSSIRRAPISVTKTSVQLKLESRTISRQTNPDLSYSHLRVAENVFIWAVTKVQCNPHPL